MFGVCKADSQRLFWKKIIGIHGNKLLQFHARLGHSLIPSENQFGNMVVVSNFEKIEDQDQEYDESDCVDLFCCAMVSLR